MASFASKFDVAQLTANSKLGFKTGLESALASLTSVQEGCFYLTSDTFRLYVGTSNNTLAPVNQGIITKAKVSDITALPIADTVPGSFYYATEDNILCVHNGRTWVQINSDTYAKDLSVTVSADKNKAAVSHAITMNDGSTKHTDTFNIVGGDNVTVTAAGKDVQVSVHDAEYKLGKPAKQTDGNIQIDLTKDGVATNAPVTFVPGENVRLGVDADGKITVSAVLTEVANSEIKTATFNNKTENGFTLVLTRADNTPITADLSPVIAYGSKGSSLAQFNNGTATLDIYTTDETDAKIKEQLQGINALTYKGVRANKEDGLPTSNVSVGDTWLQNFQGSMKNSGDSTSYDPGTLWIAQGDEDNVDGYITSATLKWVAVRNYNTDTQYSFTNTFNTANQGTWTHTVTSQAGTTTAIAESYSVSGGTKIKIRGTNEAMEIYHEDSPVDYKEAEAVTKDNEYVFVADSVVQSMTYDGQGHLMSIVDRNICVPATIVNLTAGSATINGEKEIQVTNAVNTKSIDGNKSWNGVTLDTHYASETLQLQASTAGNVNKVQLDLVWGSF